MKVLADHSDLLLELWRDDRFRTPMLVIWVASFGGALHAPVSTFYYMAIGASETDLGAIGVMMSLSSLVLSPLYGWQYSGHVEAVQLLLTVILLFTVPPPPTNAMVLVSQAGSASGSL